MDDFRNTEDIYEIEEIKRRLTPVFQRYGVRKAVLFGSYAKGEARPVSDVDILVDSGLMGLAFYGFGFDVSEALQKELDIFDVREVIANSRIDREIKNTGVRIYGS
ncbi:MAG: nucleotidyltransferase domain-containing protein [Firmicutes bacterium]|nr:nucleotidyltransferase domain-containing protein [Bacillota bacterium]